LSSMVVDSTDLRWMATGLILIVSFAGVGFPFFAMRSNERLFEAVWFQLMRVLCTGLVVSVALLHVLADGEEYLRNVSTTYPVADAAALFGIFVMVTVKEMGMMALKYVKQHTTSSGCGLEDGLLNKGVDHSEFGHTHGLPLIELHDMDLTGQPLRRFVVYMMEVSIMVHSVLVGVALGVLQRRVAVLSLTAALLFHQFFEGLALGAVAVKSGFSFRASWHLFLTFTLSCPVGAVVGIYFARQYDPADPRTAWTLGMLNALAAGTLLHIGLVELLPEDFRECRDCHNQPPRWASLLALFTGGMIMAILAIWA